MGEVNLPPEQQRAFFGDEDGEALVDLFGNLSCELPMTLQLEPYGAHWFRVARPGVRLAP